MWKIKYKIDKFLRNIIKEEINNYNLKNTKCRLDGEAGIAELMLDIKNNRLTLASHNYLCRLNIDPKKFNN